MLEVTLGIIGSGQLGSLLCQAAKKLNIKTVVISDDEYGPAQNYSDQFIFTKYDNKEKIKEFISKVDFVTYEFENIPVNILKVINKEKKVFPKPEINETIQNRNSEKKFINDLKIKTTEWAFIKSVDDIKKNNKLLPGILKSNTLGYDGHGQYVLNSLDGIKKDWCFTADYILEKKVNLKKEISVIITRFQNGTKLIYEPIGAVGIKTERAIGRINLYTGRSINCVRPRPDNSNNVSGCVAALVLDYKSLPLSGCGGLWDRKVYCVRSSVHSHIIVSQSNTVIICSRRALKDEVSGKM